MQIFTALYNKVLLWSRHRHAPRYLFGLSFAESSFFPIPPDVMLAPMAMARPERAYRYALLTTLASVLGGIFGYLLGRLAFEMVAPWLQTTHYWDYYLIAQAWFEEYGVWAILAAGFSPIPYKIFTLSAGAISMAFLPFVVASLIGRGARFYLVSGLMAWGGAKMEQRLRQYIEILGWLVIVAIVLFVLYHTFAT